MASRISNKTWRLAKERKAIVHGYTKKRRTRMESSLILERQTCGDVKAPKHRNKLSASWIVIQASFTNVCTRKFSWKQCGTQLYYPFPDSWEQWYSKISQKCIFHKKRIVLLYSLTRLSYLLEIFEILTRMKLFLAEFEIKDLVKQKTSLTSRCITSRMLLRALEPTV